MKTKKWHLSICNNPIPTTEKEEALRKDITDRTGSVKDIYPLIVAINKELNILDFVLDISKILN